MKTTLIVSSRGVVTLPAKLRAALGINTDDQVIAEATPEGILLRPAVTLPLEMYTASRIDEFDAAEAELAAAFKAVPRNKATPNAKRKPARVR